MQKIPVGNSKQVAIVLKYTRAQQQLVTLFIGFTHPINKSIKSYLLCNGTIFLCVLSFHFCTRK